VSVRWRVQPAWACALVAGLAGALVACGSQTESPPPSGSVDLPGAEESLAPTPGFRGVVLPESFPDDVPRYPGATLTDVAVESATSMIITFQTDDSVDQVGGFFVKALKSNGWWIESDQGGGILASKERRTASVMIREGPRGIQVDVVLVGGE
jgi:hypothetical protein